MRTREARSRLRPLFLSAALAGLTASCAKQAPPSAPPAPAAGSAATAAPAPSTQLDPALAATVNRALETALDVPAPQQTLSGSIVLPRARKDEVHRGETIFIAVRRAGAPRGPGSLLAAQRLQVGDFPLAFTLSDRDAMMPGARLEGPLSITVRVDKDGDPMTRGKGDVYGRVDRVQAGARKVVIALDSLQAEDEVLEGSGTISPPAPERTAALPPGHPPLDDGAGLALPPGHP
jgi:hypothetical protein